MVNTRVRPKLGFGFGAETAKNLGFGLVSVTAVTRNLVAAWLRPPETQILSSANTESYYSLSLTQSLPARMLSWLLVAVVLRDPARRAKVVTPLAGSQREFMLDSRHSLSYLIFRPSGRDIGLGVGDHIGLVARQRCVADKLSLGLSGSVFIQSVLRTTDEQQP